jgi:hypothetical protein
VTTINVTAGHIAKSRRQDCWRCPVALAIRSAFPNATAIEVTAAWAGISDGEQYAEIRLPLEASEFIWEFDDGGTPEPFTFDLDYPAVTP